MTAQGQGGARRKRSPLGPLLGFIILVSVAALAFVTAPVLITWLETAQVSLAGRELLPYAFPAGWSPLLVRGVVAAFVFLVVFVLFMLVVFFLTPPPQEESGVSLASVREEKKQLSKRNRR